MWRVYFNENLVYHSQRDALKLESAKLDLELNKTGSFVFKIHPSHPFYNNLTKMKGIVKVYKDNNLMFRGRILNDSKLFYNQKEVTCEGELAFLIDSRQRPYDFQSGDNHTNIEEFFTFLIEEHNKYIKDEEKQFKVGVISVKDPNDYIVRSDTTYLTTWESINQKLINTNEGYLRVRHESDGNYIDYLEDFEETSNQVIEFGRNLLDFNQLTKGETLATAIIPVGSDGLTISDVNNDIDYVYDEAAVNEYGWIFQKVEFNDITDAANLKTKAEEYLKESINLVVTLELSAVDLADLNKDFDSFKLGTYVQVRSKPHNVDSKFLVTKLSIDLLNPKNNKLTLGKTYLTFTEKTSSNTIKKEVTTIVHNEAVTPNQMNKTIEKVEKEASQNLSETEKAILKSVDETYLSKTDASNTYLSKTDASNTYAKKTELPTLMLGKYHTTSSSSSGVSFSTSGVLGNGTSLVNAIFEFYPETSTEYGFYLWNSTNSSPDYTIQAMANTPIKIVFIGTSTSFKIMYTYTNREGSTITQVTSSITTITNLKFGTGINGWLYQLR